MPTTRQKIYKGLNNLEPFIAGSSHGLFDPVTKNYRVISYSTLIFELDPIKKIVVYWNPNKYSVTTSKLQTCIQAVYGNLIKACEIAGILSKKEPMIMEKNW